MEKMGGRKATPATESHAPEFPELLAYLWGWFEEIMAGADASFGPAAVTWTGLKAWSEFMRVEVDPWEALALIQLGNARMRVMNEEPPAKSGG